MNLIIGFFFELCCFAMCGSQKTSFSSVPLSLSSTSFLSSSLLFFYCFYIEFSGQEASSCLSLFVIKGFIFLSDIYLILVFSVKGSFKILTFYLNFFTSFFRFSLKVFGMGS